MRRSVLTALVLLSAGCQRHAATDVLLGTVEYDRIELIAEAGEPITEIAVITEMTACLRFAVR